MLSLKDNNSLVKKIVFLFVLAILLQIPMLFIRGIVSERDYMYREMKEEIGNEWGQKQQISGAFLMIPTEDSESYIDASGKNVTRKIHKNLVVLPNDLDISINLLDEIRKRGIYKTTVYTGEVEIRGSFPAIKEVVPANIYPYNIDVGLGISDTKSIMKVEKFVVSGEDIKLESGTGIRDYNLSSGVSGNIYKNLNQEKNIDFYIKLSLRGSGGVEILPFGKNNHFKVKSTWKSPKFYGVLPSTKEITNEGFVGGWEVSSFVRNYKQTFIDSNLDTIGEGKIGVELYDSVTHYRQVTRAVKYSLLFIMLSLFVVYIFEVTSKKFTHYVQYGVVGFSLTLFYLVLLSMSEYFTFGVSYIIATAMVTLPNSLYIGALTKNKKYGLGMFAFLSGVYGVLYSILKMEEYALIAGSLLLMGVLYVIMYITRNIELVENEKNIKEKNTKIDEKEEDI